MVIRTLWLARAGVETSLDTARTSACATWLAVLVLCAVSLVGADGLTEGKAVLQSAEALAFGPDGILFVGDSLGGAVFALDTGDRTPRAAANIEIAGIDQRIAALLGTIPGQIRFHDFKVNPLSKNVYIAVSRGRGPESIPVILRVDATGKISELAMDAIRHAKVQLPGLPEAPRVRRRANARTLAITGLAYTQGQLIVAGLSNEEFSSTLRVVPFPFTQATRGTTVEIYHTSHFTYETSSPVRTLIPYTIAGEPHILAAYTCTPLVKLRLSDLKADSRVKGQTLVELGRHSSPLDMIPYRKDGHDQLLVANTARGVLKISMDGIEKYPAVNWEGGDDSQIPVHRVSALKGVVQLDKLDDGRALLLVDRPDGFDLQTIPLP